MRRTKAGCMLGVESLETRHLLDAHGLKVRVADIDPVDLPKLVEAVAAEAAPMNVQGLVHSGRAATRTNLSAQRKPSTPQFDPTQFVAKIDNPYFPLVPGTTFIYCGTEEGLPARDELSVLRQTKQILGVTTTVVRDRAFLDGELVEETLDWFAQDKQGNVWYFGEAVKNFENGVLVSTEGSWQAGVNGARPGIIMEANPRVGDKYQQETAKGVAEDRAQVVSLKQVVTVPYGTFSNSLKIRETTPLEPGVIDYKYYAPGVGLIRSVSGKSGSDVLELVRIVRF